MQNRWQLSYDLDQTTFDDASVSSSTIYARVRDPWTDQGFTKLQHSVYVLEDGANATDRAVAAFWALESNDVRRYIKSMVLKMPNGEDVDILELLDKRQAERKASNEALRRIVARYLDKSGT